MKLSMWMIANQLMELDPILEIREDAPAILNSARLAYATNCVHIYKEKDHVVCNGEGDKIIIYDMDITRVFELIQSIFDAHEDWLARLIEAIGQKNYGLAVDEAVKLLKNPFVLFNANNKVLGISSAYGPDSLDPEWKYLHTYGYSSINAFVYMRNHKESQSFLAPGLHDYDLPHNQQIELGGITAPIYFNETLCGIMTLIAKDHDLNTGDRQLLSMFSSLVSPSLGNLVFQNERENANSIFSNIMLGHSYSRDELALGLSYRGWSADDTYYVSVFEFSYPNKKKSYIKADANTIMRLINQQLSDVTVNIIPPFVTILSDRPLYSDQGIVRLIYHIINNNYVRISFSLPARGIQNIDKLYRQALFALSQHPPADQPQNILHFENYAVKYLLTSSASLEAKYFACMPRVRELWERRHLGDEMFHTLRTYLECERSISQTAASLFLHRNTAVYRIKKIQDHLRCDLDDPQTRNYCLLSVLMIEEICKDTNKPEGGGD